MSSPAPWNDARAKLEGASLGVPIEWPNGLSAVPNPPALYIAVEMTGEVLAPMELGAAGAWREEGWLGVHIYTPAGLGTDDARALAKRICDLFRVAPSGPIVYPRATIGDGRAEDVDGGWWRLSVHIDYRYTDIVA